MSQSQNKRRHPPPPAARAPSHAAPRPGRLWVKRLLLALLSTFLLLGATEGILRAIGFRYEPRQKLLFKPWVGLWDGTRDEHYNTVWDPPGYVWTFPPEAVAQNDFLQRPGPKKTPGVKRIVFLGGSTSQPHRWLSYPRRTVKLLNDAAGTNAFEEFNLGMSSYATFQSLIVLERYGLPSRPDCVVVYHGWNDAGVAGDGYDSKEKDALMRLLKVGSADRRWVGYAASRSTAWARRLRLGQLVGRLADALDVTWPRPNVNPADFRANLQRMADLCRERGIPLVIVKKPVCRTTSNIVASELERRHYGPRFGTNGLAIYLGKHQLYSAIQAEVAAANPNTRLADAEAHLDRAQQRLAAAPREGVSVFVADAMHCTPLGYQFIAEAVAPAVAPELADRLEAYRHSGRYWQGLAEEFRRMDSPFECDYAVEQALQRSPELAEALRPLREWAQSQFAFKRLFDANWWVGYKRGPLEEALPNLVRCLEMRPHDFGVAQQVHRVALYHGHTDRALPGLLKFQATNEVERYRWLQLVFDSALQAQNFSVAEQTAREALRLNPQDAQAAAVLRQIYRPR